VCTQVCAQLIVSQRLALEDSNAKARMIKVLQATAQDLEKRVVNAGSAGGIRRDVDARPALPPALPAHQQHQLQQLQQQQASVGVGLVGASVAAKRKHQTGGEVETGACPENKGQRAAGEDPSTLKKHKPHSRFYRTALLGLPL